MISKLRPYLFLLAAAALIAAAAASTARTGARELAVSQNIVISQVYGGGGNNGSSVYTHDFVELFNRGDQAVSLNGWSTQYASSGGTGWLVTPMPNVTLQPGKYLLIQYATSNNGGGALPTPDVVAPPVTVGGNSFVPNLSATSGKMAVVNSVTPLSGTPCPTDGSLVDLVGYGDGASCYEGVKTPNLSVTTAAKRKGDGCTDTDNNASDFAVTAPTPRNSSAAANTCNLGSTLQAGISANPNTSSPGGHILFTVSVIPATSPPSTAIGVAADLTPIGGAASTQFYDDGTHGDVTAGDNVFSYLAEIPPGTTGGSRLIVAVASDGQGRTVALQQSIMINAPLPNDDPLIFGNPSGATPDISNENNYLMPKPQYTLSYNRSKATANWVAWRLDSSWIGGAQRQDDFRPDPALPNGWYAVTDSDYSGSGYDRGHMTPSGDRTNSVENNSATFLMTNIIPQLAANNQGPWEQFESYCRTLAQQGKEIYIIAGTQGNIGTIAGGNIVVPAYTWKVVLILPNGDNDLQRVTKGTRAFGIIIPNQPPLSQGAPWRDFRVTVDAVEYLTGYDFFSAVPKITQELMERRRDKE